MKLRLWIYPGLIAFVVGAWAALDARPTRPLSVPVGSVVKASLNPSPEAPELAQRAVLELASKDPFASSRVPVAAPVPAQVKATVTPPFVQVTSEPPPAPVAPPLNLRFTGRMRGPDGHVSVFALLDNESVTLIPGLALSNGYRVERITDSAVEFTYPALNTSARLDLPTAPSHEVR